MAAYNKVILVGNLTTDPELRRIGGSGTAVCTLRVAVDDSYQNRNGEKVDRTVYVDCDVWDKQAENCQRFLSKGSPVLVDGRLQMDTWQDRDSGATRSKLKVRAERVQFLGSRRDGGAAQGGGAAAKDGGYDRPAQGPANPAPFADPLQQTGGEEDIPF